MKLSKFFIDCLKWIIRPWIRIRLKNAIGEDGVSRPCYKYVGTIWEWHQLGYWKDWYDGPIHHFSLGPLQIYWCDVVILLPY
jgi:hypothetical protein